jgi:hypothetical protein
MRGASAPRVSGNQRNDGSVFSALPDDANVDEVERGRGGQCGGVY